MNTLNNVIKRHKDNNSLDANNSVIYRIQCKDCDASYVSQTKRQLRLELKHKKNINQDITKHSVVTNHMLEFEHSFDWDNVEILDFEPQYHKTLISEIIYIKSPKNSLNLNDNLKYILIC